MKVMMLLKIPAKKSEIYHLDKKVMRLNKMLEEMVRLQKTLGSGQLRMLE